MHNAANAVPTLSSRQIEASADALLAALDGASCLARLPSAEHPGIGLPDGFAIAQRLAERRSARGEKRLGWKIGFTNRSIWQRYGVHAPIWGPVWSTSTELLAHAECKLSLSGLSQPRLEPEIVFGFCDAPQPEMSLSQLQGCIDWVAHGFEVVHTHCEAWRFTAADCVADFALHGRLRVGPRVPVQDWPTLAADLAQLQVQLVQGKELLDTGQASVVLDGPLHALQHWLRAMAEHTPHWQVQAGDVVTTGTITDAWPLLPGQHWHTRLSHRAHPRLSALQGLSLQTLE
jgi:2-oxo-3-hexenedioate decarboxylase